ncbi:MAG: hypothetical protein OEZ34_15215 [Spirochaetia bacterium]|nr:hypothetical protein [Spirochaetia bacterium]
MNFFRKKTHIFASFGEKDLSESPAEIIKMLESLLPIPSGQELRISIAENSDLSMQSLCALAFFSGQQRDQGSRIILKAASAVIENIQFMKISDYFDDLIVENSHGN